MAVPNGPFNVMQGPNGSPLSIESYVTGNDPNLVRESLLGRGGFGQVHKVCLVSHSKLMILDKVHKQWRSTAF
jgi:hypothetical protein